MTAGSGPARPGRTDGVGTGRGVGVGVGTGAGEKTGLGNGIGETGGAGAGAGAAILELPSGMESVWATTRTGASATADAPMTWGMRGMLLFP